MVRRAKCDEAQPICGNCSQTGNRLQELEDRVEGRLQQFEAVEPRKENGVDCILQAASRSSDDVLRK
jgi:hypothetical protein